MRSLNRALPVTLAVASGLATTALLYTYLSGQPSQAKVSLEPMVVAAVPVDDSEPLLPEDVKVVQVLQRPTGAFTSVSELQGRLPLVAIGKGEPILTSHLAPAGSKPGLWNRIPAGMRAVTVAINEVVGVGGFLKPGLFVDVISVTRQNQDFVPRTVVQNVEILAMAQDDKEKKESRGAKVVPSATLLVTPEQAEAITLATEEGQIRLALRAPDDTEIRKVAPPPKPKPVAAKPAPRAAAPAPRRPAPAAKPQPQAPAPVVPGIEVIHGNNSEVVRP